MFDGLLKSKFHSKCKSDIKMVRTRIEMIKRKRNATQKYLKKDVADLLKNGSDYNAYGRAEGLLAEMIRSQCYESIDQYCYHILNHLSTMDKQRECPEECREAASSLMFAAARFADLPELRELRAMFSERYGKSVDYYINKQFEEKLKSGLPSNDMKLQLLRDIAAESGFKWNSKALENKLFSESAYNKKFDKETTNHEHSPDKHMDTSVQKKGSKTIYEFYPINKFNGDRKKDIGDEDKSPSPQTDNVGTLVKDIRVDRVGKKAKPQEPASVRKTPKEEDEDKPHKYKWVEPPYIKCESNTTKDDVGPTEPDKNQRQDDPLLKAKPMVKSVRTRTFKHSPVKEIAVSFEGGEKEDVRVREINKEQGKRILKFLDGGGHDQRDEEEKVLDKLLQRYSRKDAHKAGKLESILKTGQICASIASDKEGKHRSRDGPSRVSSLPAETSGKMETPKKQTRAASFHPDGNAHVHPKLPDYDDFVARLAEFRGK